MEAQTEKLNTNFKRFEIPEDDSEEYGDSEVLGECWEWKEPHQVQFWTLMLVPMSTELSFMTKYSRSEANLPVSLHESVKEVTTGPNGMIFVCCKTTDPEQAEEYHFSYVVSTRTTTFSISTYYASLTDTAFCGLQKDLEKSISEKKWLGKDGEPIIWKSLASKLNSVVKSFDYMKVELDSKSKKMTPISLTREYSSQGGSQTSLVLATPETGCSHTRRKTTERYAHGNPSGTPPSGATARGKKTSTLGSKLLAETSIVSDITTIPVDLGGKVKDIDYEESCKHFNDYWAVCTGSYVGDVTQRHKISIDQLETPPQTLNIRGLKEVGVKKTLNFLLNMPNPDTKMTLCAMPQDQIKKPESFDKVSKSKFWMVNGQHCVEASKRIQTMKEVPKDKAEKFKVRDCFIIWNTDHKIIRKISAFYNRVNHFDIFQPTWATNIIGARYVWEQMRKPSPPKDPTKLGRQVQAPRRIAKDAHNIKNFGEFKDAMKLRFSMIDVKKNQGALSQKKDIDIHNELKIITASQDVYDLWSKVISSQAQGELVDPDSLMKFKCVKGWDAEKDGVIAREFFKWIGNCSEADLRRLALHILNMTPKRQLAYPKVTMKALKVVIPDCYTAKEWLERCKRKQAVKRQIHFLKKSLRLYDNEGNMRRKEWKKFKADYNVTRATMNTLVTAPGEKFFSLAKMPSNKLKAVEELSPLAADFFKVFLSSKGKFVTPEAEATFRSYNKKDDEMDAWDPTYGMTP